MKKFLLALTMVAAVSGSSAFAAHNYTVANATAKQGETVTLTIKLVHTIMDVAGYQGTLTAPSTGFTVGEFTLKNAPAGETDMQLLTYAKNAYTRNFLSYSPSLLSYTSKDDAGEEVATFTITIADDVTPGDYTFNFSNMVFSTNDGGTTEKLASGAGSFKITVEKAGDPYDFDGSGEFDLSDVQLFFNDLAIEGDLSKYPDVTGDGEVDLSDVQELFNILSNQ